MTRAATLLLLLLPAVASAADVEGDTYFVGTAKVDVTPKTPIRLNGFGFRRAESEGVEHPIHVRAMSIRHSDDALPVVLVTADVLGFPAHLRAEIEKRVLAAVKLPPERLALFATHTHCGPMLSGANPTLFGVPIPEDHQKRIDEYAPTFVKGVVEAITTSTKNTVACKLSWGIGSVGFAMNRRNGGGPTDHDLPVLVARDAKTGTVRAIHAGYACHCVTLSHNKLGGDWAGYAAEAIEDRFPDAVGLVSIGCGADQNPNSGVTGGKVEVATVQGRSLATEVKRLVGGYLAPVRGKPVCKLNALDLPLAAHPDKKGWEELAKRQDAIGHHARVQLAKLDKKVALPTTVNYPIQTWTFGDSLAMVHLPGEVVVDYALRLKKELDRSRVWIAAYANTNPCYIPSERILKEGGYEGGGAMVYYDLPTPFRPGLEDRIVGEVRVQLGKTFDTPLDIRKNVGAGPLPAQRSAARLRTDARFAVDLVAAEPLVASPVAIAFGADGRLWVAEMIDYPNGKAGKFEPGGRVRFLEDTDGDGFFDKATTFLDGIPFPTGLLPWRKGMLVCTAPDVLYAEDTNGDGKADKVEKLLTGFGTGNYQARVNGLAYGLDGWVYASCGLFGGEILSAKTGKKFPLGDRDFRFKPDTGEIEPATGRTQQGRVRDDWGSWFGCDNSNLGWHYLLDDADLRRNPYVVPPSLVSPLVTGEGNQLFPIGNPQMFTLSGPVGRPTAACGIGLYRDDRLGSDARGNVFTCEPVNNLVTRRVLEARGATFVGVRAAEEKSRDFVASDDRWFRPVQATTGPDGALWVVDMHRFVIEHTRWIPPADVAALDVRAGATLGRIYRVRRADARPTALPRLDKLDTAGLVAALDSVNGWQRDTATELLAWKADRTAVPLLQKLLRESARPEARLHALASLERLASTGATDVVVALADSHPGVRSWAYRAAAKFAAGEGRVAKLLRAAVTEPDPRARLSLAAALADCEDSGPALAALAAAHSEDRHLLAAVVSSLNRTNFRPFVSQPEIARALASPLLGNLIATAVGLNDEPSFTAMVASAAKLTSKGVEAWQYAALEATLVATARSKTKFALPAEAKALLAAAWNTASQDGADPVLRVACVRLMVANPERSKTLIDDLASLLAPRHPTEVKSAALAALGRMDDARASAALLAAWDVLSPAHQNAAVAALLGRETRLNVVLDAVATGKLPASAIHAGSRQWLLTHENAAIRKRAEAVFSGTNRDRQQVIDRYRADATKGGDGARGKAVFAKTCAACHKLDGVGQAVGPDLAGIANKTREYLLAEILDPNRNLDNRYVEYRAATTDGRTVAGVLAAESSNSVTLRGADGKETTLLRADLDVLKSTGRSLMPEGLEKDIAPTAMADLLAYLGAAAQAPKRLPGNEPKPVKPTDGVLTLKAADAEISGNDITFETDFGNIGLWHGATDHVRWRIELLEAGKFDVYLDAACDNGAAGNAYAIDGGEPTLRGKTTSTGGWANYRWVKVGTTLLPKGESRLTVRPDTPAVRGALMDLRTVALVPAGRVPAFLGQPKQPKQPAVPDTPEAIGRALLDDKRPTAEREALVAKLAGKSAPAIAEMARAVGDSKEEYRRIPWIWRVAIAAGKRNDAEEIAAILTVSLPKKGEPLRDWQAVVLGGGLINGISLSGPFPGPRLAEILKAKPDFAERWKASLETALKMTDDERVPTGTRYDALRMLPLLDKGAALKPLTKYLAKGTHAELQMGAVSGLCDLDVPESTALLVAALDHLTGTNRALALHGLTRADARATALLDAVAGGKVAAKDIDTATRKLLRESKTEAIRQRAAKLLGG